MEKTFIGILKKDFKNSGLSQHKYAKYIGITRGSLSNHLRGLATPSIAALRKYASRWRMNVGDLVDMIKSERGYYDG